MKNIITLLLLLSTALSNAQEGFGTNNPAPSSVIDMVGSNKGALLPRVALTTTVAAGPISAPADALTVFNTATAGVVPNNVVPGYYYWSATATQWIRILDSNTADPTNDAWINNSGNARIELSTLSNGATARPAGTEVVVTDAGLVGVRTSSPNSALTINGSANNLTAYDAVAATTIDFSQSNLAYTAAEHANTFTLQNLKNGGTYTLAIKGTVSGTAAFMAPGFTVHLPVDHGASTAGKHSIYTMLVLGTDVYMSWIAGY